MKKVIVITGGAGGMGLATAKLLGRDHPIVICDVNQQRLESAIEELKKLGVRCDSMVCDVTDRASVGALVSLAVNEGEVRSVIHTAGISPHMADADTIMKVNALGTINITEAFYEVATEDFVQVNVASMAAHMVPGWLIPMSAYSYAFSNRDVFLRKAMLPCRLMPNGRYRTGMAYAISKNFVVWYSRKNAARFGQKDARILSASPGMFDTAMGRLEDKNSLAEMLKDSALKRVGRPEEMAELLAFCVSDKASYITGTDILCDGGVVASKAKF